MRSDRQPFIVGIGGTARPNSSSEQALRLALDFAGQAGARTALFAAQALRLDTFDPGDTTRTEPAHALVQAMRQCDGLLIATPSYHGSLSGLVKNALDYAEDLRNDERPYFDGRAVGCIVCADGVQAMGSTLMALRAIVHALRGWPTPFAAAIDSGLRPFASGTPDPGVLRQLELVSAQVMEFARARHAVQAMHALEASGALDKPRALP